MNIQLYSLRQGLAELGQAEALYKLAQDKLLLIELENISL